MILKLKRIRSSCKYIHVRCGLSSSIACIASVSVQFRSEERRTRNDSQRPRKKRHPLSFFGSHIISCSAKTKNPIPRSFFAAKSNGSACYTSQQFCGALLIGKLVFITGVIFSHFLGERRSTAQSEQGVPDTHNVGRHQWCVDRQ